MIKISYLDEGYNEFLEKVLLPFQGESGIDFDAAVEQIGGQKIVGEQIISRTGMLNIDLVNGRITFSDNARNRIVIGKQENGDYGIKIIDNDGNTLLEFNNNNSRVSSTDGKTYFDLNEKRLIVNDGITDRVLIGYQKDGF